jgi:hypothetical protein
VLTGRVIIYEKNGIGRVIDQEEALGILKKAESRKREAHEVVGERVSRSSSLMS